MKNQQKTQNRDQIKSWITSHNGTPVTFDYPNAEADKIGIRIDFPGSQDEVLHNQSVQSQPLSWDEFFDLLAERKLIFVYDEEASSDDDLTMAYHFENDETDTE